MGLVRVIGSFKTTITTKISKTATSWDLSNPLTDDGSTIADGLYGFTLEQGTAKEEYIVATVVSGAITAAVRGVSLVDGQTSVAALKQTHRRGASIEITNHPGLIRVVAALLGEIETGGNVIKIGDGTDADIYWYFYNADGTKPYIKYDKTTNKILFSPDGVNEYDVTAGGGGLTAGNGIQLIAGAINIKFGASDGLEFNTTNVRVKIKSSVAGFLNGGQSPTTVIATWQAVTNGSFAVTIDGLAANITGLNFSTDTTLALIAARIQTALRAINIGGFTLATCTYDSGNTRFVITSGRTGSASSVSVLSAVGSGTDISGAGATAFLDSETGRGTATAGITGGVVRDSNGLSIDEAINRTFSGRVLFTAEVEGGANAKLDFSAGAAGTMKAPAPNSSDSDVMRQIDAENGRLRIAAGENLTAGQPCYIDWTTQSLMVSHGYKELGSGSQATGSGLIPDLVRLNDTQFINLKHSSNTITVEVRGTNSAVVASATVTTSAAAFDSTKQVAGVARIDDTKFIVIYRRSTGNLYYRSGSISGGTITMNTDTDGGFAIAGCGMANALIDGKACVVWFNGTDCHLRYYTVGTNTFTQVTDITVTASQAPNFGIVAMAYNGLVVGVFQNLPGSTPPNYPQLTTLTIDTNDSSTNSYTVSLPSQTSTPVWNEAKRGALLPLEDSVLSCWQHNSLHDGSGARAINWFEIFLGKKSARSEVTTIDTSADGTTGDGTHVRTAYGCRHHGYLLIADNQNDVAGNVIGSVYKQPNGMRGNVGWTARQTIQFTGGATPEGKWWVQLTEDTMMIWSGGNYYYVKMPTRVDGFVLSTVTAGNTAILQRLIGTALSGKTPGAQYFLKDAWTNEGELDLAGAVEAGKALSASKLARRL